MNLLKPTHVYTQNEKAELFINAIRANTICADIRKQFNLCNAKTPSSQVNPEFCENEAKNLIDCFQRVRMNFKKDCEDLFNTASNCLSNGDNCDTQLDNYFNCEGL